MALESQAPGLFEFGGLSADNLELQMITRVGGTDPNMQQPRDTNILNLLLLFFSQTWHLICSL
jgi:hypothetical protein